MTEFWGQTRAAPVSRPSAGIQEEPSKSSSAQPQTWSFYCYFFGMKLFSQKIYEHVHLTPCRTWQLPAASLRLGCLCFQVLCLSPLKNSGLGIVKYLKSDLSCVSAVPSPPQSIITLAHLCDRNNSFCLPKLQSPVARQLRPEATKQRGTGVWEDQARVRELLLVLLVAIIGGSLEYTVSTRDLG